MTRDEFVLRFRWNRVMWVMGFVNVFALLPQPVKILRTQQVAGISVSMFILFLLVQVAFGIEFFIKKSWGAMVSMVLSASLSLITIGLVFLFR